MLSSLHGVRACGARSAAEWGFGGVLGQKNRHHHIFTNMQIQYCMRIAVCSGGSQLPDATKLAQCDGL
jgi:hypothetical protein